MSVYFWLKAADIVFRNWNHPTLTVVSWELCEQNSIEWSTYDRLFSVPTPDKSGGKSDSRKLKSKVGIFLSKCLQFTFGPQNTENRLYPQGAVICDPIAMAYFLDPSIETEKACVHVEVELKSSLTKGQTVIDWGHCFDGIERPKNVKWITKINKEIFLEMLEKICFD